MSRISLSPAKAAHGPVTQIELKTLGINPRRAREQIVDNKDDPHNGYSKAHP
ncbi:MAG: hypothetical protein AMXMBFR20_33410 [Planctomycetia bacterium]|jgi:hypothetical protein